MQTYINLKTAIRILWLGCLFWVKAVVVWADIPTEIAKLQTSEGIVFQSFSISGNTLAAGGYSNNSRAVYIFTQTDGVWSQQAKLAESNNLVSSTFFRSVSISGDTLLVGAGENENTGGPAYVYTRSNGGWALQAALTPSDITTHYAFGRSVAISGNTAVVGDGNVFDPQLNQWIFGAAYVFIRSNGVWTQQARLSPPDGQGVDDFGVSVSISEDRVVVGAENDDDKGELSGSAYVFRRNEGVWYFETKLTPPNVAVMQKFGYSVAISGDTVLVGAMGDDEMAFRSGAVYAFTHINNGVWTQQAKLKASDAADVEWFGSSVAISGNTSVIGTEYGYTKQPGAAYVFTRSGATWTQQSKLKASDSTSLTQFGSPVSISGNTAVIGAYSSNNEGTSSLGSAYVFNLNLDDDGDGVFNDIDRCPSTQQDGIVDSLGCSIAQYCPCKGAERGRNHGNYVSCVAKRANSFETLGLINKTQKGAVVSQAARSDCNQ